MENKLDINKDLSTEEDLKIFKLKNKDLLRRDFLRDLEGALKEIKESMDGDIKLMSVDQFLNTLKHENNLRIANKVEFLQDNKEAAIKIIMEEIPSCKVTGSQLMDDENDPYNIAMLFFVKIKHTEYYTGIEKQRAKLNERISESFFYKRDGTIYPTFRISTFY